MINRIHKTELLAGASLSVLALSALLLSSPSVSADTSHSVGIGVTVPTTCSISVNTASHTASIDPGTQGTLGTSTISTLCNDTDGFAIYAVGYSNDTIGNNTLISAVDNSNTIASNTASSPSASQWNMTLSAVSGTYAPTITNQTTGDNPVGNFTQPHTIPTTYTKVAYRNSATGTGVNPDVTNFTASFNAYVDSTQAPGDYQGKVKFLLTHPNVTNPDTAFLTLQNADKWADSVALGETIEAIDERDGQMYKVSRYKMNAEGTETALWMSNLNLGDTTNYPLLVSQLDSTNSNMPTASAIPVATFNSWKKTSGTGSYTDAVYIPLSGQEDSYRNKYGTLYNYAAASAGTYTYASGSGTGNAQYSLCPSGWRLPTGGSSGEFGKLMTGYGGLTSTMRPSTTPTGAEMFAILQQDLGFPPAGVFYGTTRDGQESFGIHWSSTKVDNSSMNVLYFDSSSVAPADNSTRPNSYSVRCIKQAPLHTLTISTSTGVDSVTIDGTTYHNGDTVDLEEGTSHTISMTFASGYAFDSWSISGTGSSVASTSTQSTTLTMGTANSTLTASAKIYIYIQDLTLSQCSTLANGQDLTVYDRRDGSDYTVRYLNNQCWMTQNLRITGTISATDSNFSSPSSFNISQYDLTDSTNCAGSGASDFDPKGYSNVCSHYSAGDADTGNKPTAWYNFAAATAGSITGRSNSTDASSDICPAGWRLPTYTEQSNLGTATKSDITVFSPVHGGRYEDGSIAYAGGYWWSATASGSDSRYIMFDDTSAGRLYTNGYFTYRSTGHYVRCVRTQ